MDIGSLNDWTKGSANRASTTSVATRKVEALQERNTTAGQAHEPEPASLERIAEAVGNIQEFVQTVRRDINFSLYEGEIVGIAGLMGAGRTETTRAIFGADPKESGEICLDGHEVKIEKPMDAIKAGIVLAPEDRKKDGLCTKLSIRQNLELPNLDLVCNKLGCLFFFGCCSHFFRRF
jgi:ABC-type sugar transport system ATPase subunit